MACCAFKKDLGDCRNWSSYDSRYCHLHKKITPDEQKNRWMKRFLLGGQGYPVFSYLWSSRYEGRILQDLREGVVTLTKEDILKIPPYGRYIDVYSFLVLHGFASPRDHPKLLGCCYAYYCSTKLIHYQMGKENISTRILNVIQKVFLTSSGDQLHHFLMAVPLIAKKSESLSGFLGVSIPKLLDTEAAKELSWWSRSDLDAIRLVFEKELGIQHPLTQCLVQRWLLDLKELYQTEKAIQKIKMDHCKEELMMNRWHPSRVWWYLERGLDIEDM
jgi:hypothetical protein